MGSELNTEENLFDTFENQNFEDDNEELIDVEDSFTSNFVDNDEEEEEEYEEEPTNVFETKKRKKKNMRKKKKTKKS